MEATLTEQKPSEEAPLAEAQQGPEQVRTADALKKRAVHPGITLPSGAVITVRIPNLFHLVKVGKMPNELIEAALAQQNAKELTKEIMVETWDYTEWVVPLTLVIPEVTTEDVAEMDPLDVEMLANFAARRIDLDAVGHQLGGLETQKSFRDFRDLTTLGEALGGQ